jgi:DNA ligase (NAD+)
VIEKLSQTGFVFNESNNHQDAPLAGKSFVFTGALSRMGRNEAKNLVESLGGSVTSSVTRMTDYVVAGEATGSKLDKARQDGITILDEAAFLALTGSKAE